MVVEFHFCVVVDKEVLSLLIFFCWGLLLLCCCVVVAVPNVISMKVVLWGAI